jgi:hypothetical protein
MSNHTTHKSVEPMSGLVISHYEVCAAREDSDWGLTGDAFYADVPVTAQWMIHSESLDLIECYEFGEDCVGCECEVDYNCHLHAHRAGTFIETRYAGLDAEEAYAHGRFEDM